MKKYFEVAAKCGHVGRGHYYEGHFFVAAQCASNAAKAIKRAPRVKHDHEDAILWVKEINHEEYVEGCISMENNPYFNVDNSSQQALYWDEIKGNVYPETEKQLTYRDKQCKRLKPKNRSKYGYRNYYRYIKNNTTIEYDYEYAYAA